MELGRYSEAEQALNHSLDIRETGQALNNFGVVRYFQRRYNEAAAYQERALAYYPNSFTCLLNVADNLRWSGRAGQAKPYYRRAREKAELEVTSNPQSAQARAYLADASVRLGQKHSAELEITEAENLLPGDGEVLQQATVIYEALGKRDLAIEAFRGLTHETAKDLAQDPDLSEFFEDPRVKQQMVEKGDQ